MLFYYIFTFNWLVEVYCLVDHFGHRSCSWSKHWCCSKYYLKHQLQLLFHLLHAVSRGRLLASLPFAQVRSSTTADGTCSCSITFIAAWQGWLVELSKDCLHSNMAAIVWEEPVPKLPCPLFEDVRLVSPWFSLSSNAYPCRFQGC